MPKDNRRILNAVRGANNQLFKDGMEDELAAELSQKRLEELKRDGVLAGDWTSTRGASMTAAGDAPSRELESRASAAGVEITGTLETAKFDPLSLEETVERMNNFDFSEDVTRSLAFHGDAVKKEILKRQTAAQAGATSEQNSGQENNQPGDDEFPAEFPARSKFIKLDKTLVEVKEMTREQLIELDGIAEKTADEVLAYLAEQAK